MKTKQQRNPYKRLEESYSSIAFVIGIILFMTIFIWLFILKINLQEENEMLKEQILTWKINLINCESSIEDSYGVTRISQNTTIEFSNYDKYKEWLDDIENGEYIAKCEKIK